MLHLGKTSAFVNIHTGVNDLNNMSFVRMTCIPSILIQRCPSGGDSMFGKEEHASSPDTDELARESMRCLDSFTSPINITFLHSWIIGHFCKFVSVIGTGMFSIVYGIKMNVRSAS